MEKITTKVQAIAAFIRENGGSATLQEIYENIERFYKGAKVSAEWQAGIRGVIYRERRNTGTFKQIAPATIALVAEVDAVNLTPREKVGSRWVRRRMKISLHDYEKLCDVGHVRTTNLNTRVKYLVRKASCGFACKCDAIAEKIV